MYNYFSHYQQETKKLQQSQQEKKSQQHEKKRAKCNEKAIVKFRERAVEKFVSELNQPTQKQQIIRNIVRTKSNHLNLGSDAFHFQPHSQQQRLSHNLEKNKILDPIPFSSSKNHHFRNHNSGNVTPFIHSNESSRLKESINRIRKGNLEIRGNSDSQNIQPNHSFDGSYLNKQGMKLNSTGDSRCIFPELNQKKYPKSYYSLVCRTPFGALKNIQTPQVKKSSKIKQPQLEKKKVKDIIYEKKERKIKFNTIHISECS